jgi:2-oxoglutarate ferredoxin oxidoreductase subunit alpha
MFDLTIEAFNVSEEFRCPAFIMADEIVGHLRERLNIPKPEDINLIDRKKPSQPLESYAPFRPDEDLIPPMACFGEGYRFYATGLTHDETGHPQTDSAEEQTKLVQRLCDKIRRNRDMIVRVERTMLDDAETCVIAYGSVARSALAAVIRARGQGLKVGLLRLITLWPFAEKEVEEVADEVDRIIVAEMNCGQIVREVERRADHRKVTFLSRLGEDPHTPEEILTHIKRVAG